MHAKIVYTASNNFQREYNICSIYVVYIYIERERETEREKERDRERDRERQREREINKLIKQFQ